jgi:hypothetical protein
MDLVYINQIRKNMIEHLFKYHVLLPYGCAEFGVYKGTTARYIADNCDGKTIYLFDSFEGLPECWNKNYKKGDFKLNKIPDLPEEAIIYKGWFDKTIPDFLNKFCSPLSFIHIDSDLYSSAKTVLFGLNDRIIPGTVILFDEFLRGENKAFKEWINSFSRTCVLIKKTKHLQAAYFVVR